MTRRHQAAVHRRNALAPIVGLVALSIGILTFVDPSAAESPAAAGSAFGESVNITIPGAPTITSGPLPSVTLPESGQGVADTAPSATVRGPDPSTPFLDRLLLTGELSVAAKGSPGGAASTSSASAAVVDVLGETVTVGEVRSTCSSTAGASTGSTTLTAGSLAVSGADRIELPVDPAPNTVYTGTNVASGSTFRVILNEQKIEDDSLTVTAVHVIIDGPSAAGDIVVAQASCGTSAAPGAPAADAPSSAAAAGSPAGQPVAGDPAGAPSPEANGKVTATAALPQAAATSVRAEGCAYFVNVGLFGGPQNVRGCRQPANAPGTAASPFVQLPPTGSATPITANDADGASGVYGPAVIFGGLWPCEKPGQDEDGDGIPGNCPLTAPPSGPLAASVQGTLDGTVTATADIGLRPAPIEVGCYSGYGPKCVSYGGLGPFPVQADSVHVECTSSPTKTQGSVTFKNATLATSTTAEGEPHEMEIVPDNPPANYTRSGVITNVGDVFTVVYNEQIVNADGSLTVNGAHAYLFGPTAVGEFVKGQATCGRTPSDLSANDEIPPICGTPVIKPNSPEDITPMVPLTHLIGMFDAGGIKSVTNIKATNGTVQVGNPEGLPYLQLVPGQTGPLPISVIRNPDAETANLPLSYSFDVSDMRGNVTSVSVSGTPPKATCPAVLFDGRRVSGEVAPPGTKTTSDAAKRTVSALNNSSSATGPGGGKAAFAKTGANSLRIGLTGGLLVACGWVLVRSARRRQALATSPAGTSTDVVEPSAGLDSIIGPRAGSGEASPSGP